MTSWQCSEAEVQLDEVIEAALLEGPQLVTEHGKEIVVIVAYEAFVVMIQAHTSLDEALAGAHEEILVRRDKTPLLPITLE